MRLPRFPIYITYNNSDQQDGFGAQSLRILGCQSVAKFFRMKYFHSGLRSLPKDELVGSSGVNDYESTLTRLNGFLFTEESISVPENIKIIRIRVLSRRILAKYLLISLARPNRYLLSITLPDGLLAKSPNIYNVGLGVIRKNLHGFFGLRAIDKNLVVIHIRSNTRFTDPSRPQLSAKYYSDAVQKLLVDFRVSPDSEVVIHTDFEQSDLESLGSDSLAYNLLDFFTANAQIFPNQVIKYYSSIENVIADFFQASHLIMSRSALSYFGGLINNNIVIYPPLHGMQKLGRWVSGPEANIDHQIWHTNE